ncbi:MAG: hypothetical protein ACOC9W_02330 [Persicimonas sp.]
MPPVEVRAPSASADSGKLMLSDEGLWAYVPERGAPDDLSWEAGQLVGFVAEDARHPSHLYTVVLDRSWGVLLQRLDAGDVEPRTTAKGELVGIDSTDDLRRWGVCRGKGTEISSNDCIETRDNARQNPRAWRLYSVSNALRLDVTPHSEWGMSLPVSVDGLLHEDRALVDERAADAEWIAVPARRDSTPLLHARVGLDASCSELDLDDSLQPLDVFEAATLPASDHPVDIEAAAVRTGADVLIECSDEQITLYIPSLYRPLWRAGTEVAAGISFGTLEPVVVPTRSAAARRTLGLFGAAVGTGSAAAADYFLERALGELQDERARHLLALEFMQIPSAAGRPEAALRAGRRSASGAWHTGNRPDFVLGRAWVSAALGLQAEFSELMNRLVELSEQEEHHRARLWLTWGQLREALTHTSTRGINGPLTYYEDHDLPKWLEAADLLVASGDGESEPPSESALQRAFRADAAEACADALTCLPDIYGRNFAAILSGLDERGVDTIASALASTATGAWRPGFRLPDLLANFDDSPGLSARQRLSLGAALMAFAPRGSRAELFEVLVAASAEAIRAGRSGSDRVNGDRACVEADGAQHSVGRLAALEATASSDPVLPATRWLISTALPAACESSQAFADTLAEGLGDHPELATHAAPLLEAVASGAEGPERMALLRRFADFAAEHENGAACKRWNLALSVSNARVGRLEQAESHLARAINCGGRDAELAKTQQLLVAYLRFEKSAKIPDDTSADIRRGLAGVVRHQPAEDAPTSCFGLSPMDYRLEDFVAAEVGALAVAMPERPPNELMLETASDSSARGIASTVVARRFLAQGRPSPAAEALIEARANFERVQNRVGLRRVRFFEEVVFGGDLTSFSPDDGDESSSERPRTPKAPSLARVDRIDAAGWAASLRAGHATDILDALGQPDVDWTPSALRAAVAASMVVRSEEHTAELLRYGSGQSSLESLCRSTH